MKKGPMKLKKAPTKLKKSPAKRKPVELMAALEKKYGSPAQLKKAANKLKKDSIAMMKKASAVQLKIKNAAAKLKYKK